MVSHVVVGVPERYELRGGKSRQRVAVGGGWRLEVTPRGRIAVRKVYKVLNSFNVGLCFGT